MYSATNPVSVSINGVDQKLVDREKSILIEQSLASGKSREIAEKMVNRRQKNFWRNSSWRTNFCYWWENNYEFN